MITGQGAYQRQAVLLFHISVSLPLLLPPSLPPPQNQRTCPPQVRVKKRTNKKTKITRGNIPRKDSGFQVSTLGQAIGNKRSPKKCMKELVDHHRKPLKWDFQKLSLNYTKSCASIIPTPAFPTASVFTAINLRSPIPRCVTLVQSLSLSVPQFPYLYIGDNSSYLI